jgi:hypothetical protein
MRNASCWLVMVEKDGQKGVLGVATDEVIAERAREYAHNQGLKVWIEPRLMDDFPGAQFQHE